MSSATSLLREGSSRPPIAKDTSVCPTAARFRMILQSLPADHLLAHAMLFNCPHDVSLGSGLTPRAGFEA